jgi:hypothetical protein
MTLPDFLTIARLARHIPTSAGRGLSHQRASWMLAHIDQGDNRARVEAAVKAACEALKNEIENYLNNQK